MTSVVVIGAGVAGLTTALILARKGYKVTVVAQHMPGDLSIDYTSPWAAAQWLTAATSEREEGWDRITYEILWDLASNHPESGVCKVPSVDYYECSLQDAGVIRDGQTDVWYKDLVHDFRILPSEELPQGAKSGISLVTVSINPLIYLPYLQSQLLGLGTTFLRRHIKHISEAFTLTAQRPAAVVNATGILASKLGGVEDENIYPLRGQTILVSNECSRMYSLTTSKSASNKSWAYIIPRAYGGGTILGGCRQADNWSGEVDHDLAHTIAVECVALAPELTGGKGTIESLDIIRHIVGLRPGRRGGPRVEIESIEAGLVAHNYGAGGAGFQNSWGMASNAVELLEQALSISSTENA